MPKVKESPQVKKIREKLRKEIQKEHKIMTSKGLKEISKKVRALLQRQHPPSKSLKQKDVTLFDENQHPAAIKSKYILKLHELLKP